MFLFFTLGNLMAMPGKHFLIETEGSSEDDGEGKIQDANNWQLSIQGLFNEIFLRCWWEDEKPCIPVCWQYLQPAAQYSHTWVQVLWWKLSRQLLIIDCVLLDAWVRAAYAKEQQKGTQILFVRVGIVSSIQLGTHGDENDAWPTYSRNKIKVHI